jgi:hypothetical protein
LKRGGERCWRVLCEFLTIYCSTKILSAVALHDHTPGCLFWLPSQGPTDFMGFVHSAGSTLSCVLFSHRQTLTECKHIHLNRFHGFGLAMDHLSNLFRRVATKDRLPTMRANGGRNVFHPDGSSLNFKYFVNTFFASFSFSTHVTPKHAYLRFIKLYHIHGDQHSARMSQARPRPASTI